MRSVIPVTILDLEFKDEDIDHINVMASDCGIQIYMEASLLENDAGTYIFLTLHELEQILAKTKVALLTDLLEN